MDGHASSIHLTGRLYFPVLVCALNGVDEVNDQAIVGYRHVIAASLLHDGTVDGVDFGGNAPFHILIHGRVAFSGILTDVMHHVQHFHIREVCAVCLGYIYGFTDHLFGKVPCVLIFNHIGDGRFGDGRERVDGQVDEQLAPDDALDVIGNSRLEAGFAQQVGDRLKMDVFFQIAADGGHTVAAVPDLAAAQIPMQSQQMRPDR